MPVESWSQSQHPYHALQDSGNIVQEGMKECKQDNEEESDEMLSFGAWGGYCTRDLIGATVACTAGTYSHGWGKGS